jgi:HK97 family phage portal protein
MGHFFDDSGRTTALAVGDRAPAEERSSIESPGVPLNAMTVMAAAGQNSQTPFGIITPAVALTSSAVWACVRVRAETIASLPLNLYRLRPDGGKERATDHPLWSLVRNRPNGVMSSYSWRERLVYAKLLRGNSFDYVRRNGAGVPIELVPLDPTKTGVGVQDGQKVFKYGDKFLGVDDVLHVLNMTIDGVVGQSTVEYARTSIALDIAQQQFGTRFFSQGTSGNLWIEAPGPKLDNEQKQRFRESWNANYSGVGNAWTPPLLGGGWKIHSLTIPNDDAQFLESRQFSVSEIARWFRVPGHKVGDLSKASYASLEQQNTEFVSDTIRPDCVQIEQELNNRLLLPSERDKLYFEFDLNGLQRGDMKSRYDCYAVGRNWGWLSADDVRDSENMNKLPDGQGTMYMVPVNMMPANKMLAAAAAPDDESEADDLADDAGDGRAIKASVEAATITLLDALQRMHRKESEAMKRAAGKPGAARELVEEFYGRHRKILGQAVYPSLRALQSAVVAYRGSSVHELAAAIHRGDAAQAFADRLAAEVCERSKAALIKADPESFEAVLADLGTALSAIAGGQATAFAAAIANEGGAKS